MTVNGLSSIESFNFFATSIIVLRVIPGSNLFDKFLVIILLFLSIMYALFEVPSLTKPSPSINQASSAPNLCASVLIKVANNN